MQLEETARRLNHANLERFRIVLQRFTYNKSLSNVGQLVLSLLSTKEEATVLEKKHKFMKKMLISPTSFW